MLLVNSFKLSVVLSIYETVEAVLCHNALVIT